MHAPTVYGVTCDICSSGCTVHLGNCTLTFICRKGQLSFVRGLGQWVLHSLFFQVYRLSGIAKLIELLRSPDENVQQAAAGALRNLVFRNPTNKLETRRQNGIRECVSLLRRTGNTEIQKQLTGTCTHL